MFPGALVRVLPPFTDAFPGVYTIREVQGTTAFLDGVPADFADAFDFDHLVLA